MKETALAADLRAAADWLETVELRNRGRAPTCAIRWHWLDAGDLAELARRLPGTARKQAAEDAFWIEGHVGLVEVVGHAAGRDVVCERRVVGTRRVPEKVIPAHDEEIVEWDCPGNILAGSGEATAAALE